MEVRLTGDDRVFRDRFPSPTYGRGGIRDGDVIVKLNGRMLESTVDLQEALMEDMALLLEVRRGNDDLLFHIEPDVIMQ